MGRRMSVTEICARMDRRRTHQGVDGGLGWTVTRTWLGGTSKRRQASIISSPLLSMVAESMVMRRPMTTWGA